MSARCVPGPSAVGIGPESCFSLIYRYFSQKHLEATVRRLPELLAEVSEVTPLQIEKYCSPLAELENYFSLGSGIIDEADLASRLTPVTAAEIRKAIMYR